MKLGDVERLRGELAEFVGDVFASLPRRDQRRWSARYLRGLMLDGRRKSIQPMAERLPDGNMQALQQFVNQSRWDPLPVRRRIACRLSEAMPPQVWVIDDVSFPECTAVRTGLGRRGPPVLRCTRETGELPGRGLCPRRHRHCVVPLDRQLYLPREWTDEPGRCRGACIPDGAVHQEKWRLALGLLDDVTGWGLRAPVVVADAGYGVSTPFRHGLDERGLSYVLALTGKEVAHELDIEPYQPGYGGLGPPTLPRYRTAPRALSLHAPEAAAAGLFAEVAWRQGSKGRMNSRFAVLALRPAGKQSLAAAQAAGGGRNQWNGVLPASTVLVQWPTEQETPTGFWISDLPPETPVADLVRWAKMRWRIEHDYRELKHGLGLDHFEGRTWRGWHHHVTLVTAAQAFLTLRRLDPKVHTPA